MEASLLHCSCEYVEKVKLLAFNVQSKYFAGSAVLGLLPIETVLYERLRLEWWRERWRLDWDTGVLTWHWSDAGQAPGVKHAGVRRVGGII